MSTTASVFGNELHRYSIADGIRDKNVLGFDPYKVLTYKDTDVRREVALQMAKASSEEEAINNPDKSKIYYKYMGSYSDKNGIVYWARWYYRLIKQTNPKLKITVLFDSNIDNNGKVQYKEDGLIEIMQDYNERFEQDFTIATHGKFKKDITARLAHKEPYLRIEQTPEKQIDLLIVVDQLLTGFDSKWLNTLYLDKMLQYENIIQAFSRTNRLFGPEKPFGTIRYYRKPHTMEENIKKAVKLYSGDKPLGLFVQRLSHNLTKMNVMYEDIADLFTHANSKNFEKLPQDNSEKGKFAKQFSELTSYLEAAKIQGFNWEQSSYEVDDEDVGQNTSRTKVRQNNIPHTRSTIQRIICRI
ncbi:MAG: hypothetical protein BKP49_00060 [Treponema sp. CETP13]|nr:MAG: hypothetical protein BKP49_00060 [Treponema sp. CETP13]